MGLRTAFRRTKKWMVPELKIMFNRRSLRDLDYKSIPIVINNYNKLTMMLKLIDSLTSRGYHNIHIIDNASTYPPLLEWYKTCPYTIYRLNMNVGHLAFWQTGIYRIFWGQYVAYTDPDVEIDSECPEDFMKRFVELLKKYPKALKAGFSIRLDDLPDCYERRDDVQKWEAQFWKKEIERGVYKAPVDTTFAVYKPYFKGEIVDFSGTYFRVAPPYSIRHLPWYADSLNLSDEDLYYLSSIKTSTHWSEQDKK